MQVLQAKEITSLKDGKAMSKYSFCSYYWKQPHLLETAIKSSIENESGYLQISENGEPKMYFYTCENYVMYIISHLLLLRDIWSVFKQTDDESWQ